MVIGLPYSMWYISNSHVYRSTPKRVHDKSNYSDMLSYSTSNLSRRNYLIKEVPGDAWISDPIVIMMTSSNGNIFCVTGHLCGEFTGPRWIPHTKASDTELWFFYRHLNKRLSKQSWGCWLLTLLRPLWRHRNDKIVGHSYSFIGLSNCLTICKH